MKWISVNDKLPQASEFICAKGWTERIDVLFCDAKGRMSVGYNREGQLVMAKPIGKITHWMPLPEPPK